MNGIANQVETQKARHIRRSSFAWNTVAGLLMAFQSVIMLMLIMRLCDVVEAGIFSIAYANANLFLNIGKYGMRQYQVSDREPLFSFREYETSRICSTSLMLIVGCVYLAAVSFLYGYSLEKVLVVLIMYLFKAVDSVEDVLHGNYQQYGRLDVGARVLTCRLSTTLIVFGVVICLSGDLIASMVAATAYTTFFFLAETLYVKIRYGLPVPSREPSKRKAMRLLKTCFPLFAAAFLLFYIGNAPKYAIDAVMNDTAQAYFGFIAMPVFIVSLLSSFIYNPMIASLADTWSKRKVKEFLFRFGRIALIVMGISFACVLLAWLFGIPVLGCLYNADVSALRNELTILVAGGSFLAIASLATLGIAIIRVQKILIPVYIVVSVAALIASTHAVSLFGITGASWVYFFSMAFLAITLSVGFLVLTLKARNKMS